VAGTDLVLLLLRHTLTVALVLLVLRALHRASAARRVFAARCGLAALLLMPLAWLLAPVLPLHLPYAVSAWLAPPAELPAMTWLAGVPPAGAGFDAPARAADLGRSLLLVYIAVVLLHFARTALAVWRLGRIAAAAGPVTAPAWQEPLERLRRQLGIKRQVRLLVSTQVDSPMSWGLRHPVIVLDHKSLAQLTPDGVLAHELAHIASRDWPQQLLARAMLALYWWHPLMYLLVRTMEQDAECAADDAALQAGVLPSQYAHTLMQVSRNAFDPQHDGALASRIAGRGAALVARIGALLEARRARGRVTRAQWCAGAALTTALVAALGGLALKGEHVVWPDQLLHAAAHGVGPGPAALLETLDNPNFKQLALAMRTRNFAIRHAVEVESFRQRAAIPALVLALQDRDPVLRQLGAWGLGEMGFPETTPALAVLLSDPAALVRAEAAGALGDMGEARWLPTMLAMLRDSDAVVRRRVAHALGDLREDASRAALEAAQRDPDAGVAAEVQWALRELRD
jgi:beta-lactamase regulating signal transducer with metallopeptidase domain